MNAADLAALLDVPLHGDGTLPVLRPCHPREARRPEDVAIAMDPALLPLLADSPARVAVVAADAVDAVPEGAVGAILGVGRPRLAMAGLTAAFAPPPPVAPGIHPSAVIEDGVVLGEGVAVGPFVHIAAGAEIGAGTAIGSHVTIGAGVRIGPNGLIHAGVRIGAGCTIGSHVILHHNASLAADGFSFVTPEKGSVESAKESGRVEATNQGLVRIYSLAAVTLGDHVEVGANACLDRGTLSDTRVGDHTKIDDLVLIGHNVTVGSHCMICGQTGVAGSAVIGDRVVLAGRVGVADHVTIGDDAVVAAGSGVGQSLKGRAVYAGTPAVERERAFEMLMLTGRLKHLFRDVKALKAAAAAGRN
ncbi:UDP-3-O-(3-hydroxymyristoyl)glucosamine N-acyltransferase [Roseospira marina]|uniref:UDP-3-O-(3-hydroxymyristoyl)glucosamine N-acyltransferase n=1 Tax=Roseospira marina TaxID=140057 RepID=A0A5M6I8Z1_9PROT|nr:UDP-3-O-(3-hydroxymyristoyl)glucosamine N-acyltransferase [Roseospira marina]KAA5604716.1 UDP-3-O-(3-hydroxymyristoyl)glucosamine N-acyltransferase [Roseospira marina]MBB4315164.1 UDP-3-O-[3-hydroxymyristoyl] glucosamine N-acyltransferase [Roseospira marina]MBB5088066.1 UDP-3-O-[3-hydroxymyristoyl] glucosamine N-acyltransferase [Roseospira marina]